nr:hypothetical protein BgiMline_000239 [Biomphalaria glabrata]
MDAPITAHMENINEKKRKTIDVTERSALMSQNLIKSDQNISGRKYRLFTQGTNQTPFQDADDNPENSRGRENAHAQFNIADVR